ncbi:class I adenylate-forming enzyme family protein [Paenibacillus xylaniclasticus]|uniref:class I adenylate-forming enzyme family protein n=1 Tax=Paenibacillus xylaniclasticus TaxID=588083 RepID=UPI0013E0C7AF|nr:MULTISPECIES: class I adenylate-forming enzyme family protein [Paenibacillus]GFN32207.1 putative fatty-acid-CoA ligase FadD [Paenibacillus curdlanolyticus]
MVIPSHLYDMIMSNKPPDQPCISYMDQSSYTYSSLRLKVEECASLLAAHGVTGGCSIAVHIPNSLTSIVLLLAIWKLNAQIVLLDSRLKPTEAERNIAAYTPHYVVEAPPLQSAFSNFAEEVEFTVRCLQDKKDMQQQPEYALVLFTSGSTGSPKVVGRTAASIREELQHFLSFPGAVQKNDVVMVLSSISHSFGLLTGVVTSLNAGASVILCSSRAPQIVRMIRKLKVSVLYGVPFHYETMAMLDGQRMELPSLRSAICAGEPLKQETHRAFLDKYGVSVGQLYGMSETGTLAADVLGTAPGTVGLPMRGRELRADEEGIFVRWEHSPYLGGLHFERYQDGWLSTQDIGRFDADGRLWHLGRSDSLVIIGGRKVYLQEIEGTIRAYDGIQEAVVVYEDFIRAYFTVNKPISLESLASWCQGELSNYKVPRMYVLVDSFRRTSTGKLLRKQLDQLPVKGEWRL